MPPGESTAPAVVVLAAPRLVASVTLVSAQALALDCSPAALVPTASTQLCSGSGAVLPSWPV